MVSREIDPEEQTRAPPYAGPLSNSRTSTPPLASVITFCDGTLSVSVVSST